jgi:hypothetical protein
MVSGIKDKFLGLRGHIMKAMKNCLFVLFSCLIDLIFRFYMVHQIQTD